MHMFVTPIEKNYSIARSYDNMPHRQHWIKNESLLRGMPNIWSHNTTQCSTPKVKTLKQKESARISIQPVMKTRDMDFEMSARNKCQKHQSRTSSASFGAWYRASEIWNRHYVTAPSECRNRCSRSAEKHNPVFQSTRAFVLDLFSIRLALPSNQCLHGMYCKQ